MGRTRVVVGVDASAPADAALAWTVANRIADDAELELLHVIDRPAETFVLDDCPDDELGEAQRVLDRALADLPGALRDRTTARIAVGPVIRTLAKTAGEDDTLVVGTHKTGYLRGRVKGSRALSIAAQALGVVVVVPAVNVAARSAVVAGIIAGTDWRPTVREAGRRASVAGQRVQLVYGINPNRLPDGEQGSESFAGVTLAAAAHLLAEEFPGVGASIRSRVHADASEYFLDASRSAALLVLPVQAGHRAARFTVAVAHDVLLNLNAPVVLVPSVVGDVPARP